MVTDVKPLDGYNPEIGLLLASLQDGTREWLGELGDVDEATLVWPPFPNGPSVGSEILHIAFVESSWIEASVGGRELTEEFRRRTLADVSDLEAGHWGEAPRVPFADYLAILKEVRGRSLDVLRNEGDPARPVRSDPDYHPDSVRWIVSHIVQHEAYHGGRCVLLKRLAEKAAER
jgi:uncharacterized damage-inducible protein DinB